MMVNIWASLSLGVIFATMALQAINFKIFHKDGRNSTRITLIVKEVMFAAHAVMVVMVTDVIRANFSATFSSMFGMFLFFGLCCWFFVFLRGLITPES
jgi:hypothetical protein